MPVQCHPERSEGSAVVTELPAVEVLGPPDAPAIVAIGGISATRHICSSDADASAGWWEGVAGPGCALDTNTTRLIGVDFLDAGEREDGRPPFTITVGDQAEALAAVLDRLGVARLHALIGASFGGLVALAFAERYPERVERLVLFGAAHRTHPMTTALKAVQRRIVELGLETGRGREGLVLARALAITTFRSEREFDTRFGPDGGNRGPDSRHPEPLRRHPERNEGSAAPFPVENYLLHQGEKFAKCFTPARFLALSLAGDLHTVDPSRITARTTLIAIQGDRNVPPTLVAELATQLPRLRELLSLRSEIGHDAFLKETEQVGQILRDALEAPV